MSTEKGEGISTQKEASSQPATGSQTQVPQTSSQSKTPETPPKLGDEPDSGEGDYDRKPAAKRDQASQSTSPSTPEGESGRPRQVIAVSASKGPTAFFNLARKFLVTDEMCDLSALEGAIVSAVDAAHLLERSKLATIVRVQTSYVTVEPKRRKQAPGSPQGQPPTPSVSVAELPTIPGDASSSSTAHHRPGRTSGRELRRARIVITVKRTESYKRWLEENPLQAIIAGDGTVDDAAAEAQETDPNNP